MKTRIITGILAFIVFFPFLLLGGNYFLFATIILTSLANYEIMKITLNKFSISAIIMNFLIITSIFFINILSINIVLLLILLSILILFLDIIITSHKTKIKDISVVYFLFTYVTIGFYALYNLRLLGLSFLLYLLVTIWMTDSGAYFGGMKYGKNKLSPNISPNKSIEGAVIGSLSSFIVAVIFYFTTSIFSNLFVALLMTIAISAVGQIGDLVESAYKREYGVKDSSNILPGHGGIFDRFDSVILAAPLLIVLLNIINN